MTWPLWSCTHNTYGHLHHICVRLTSQQPMKSRQGNGGGGYPFRGPGTIIFARSPIGSHPTRHHCLVPGLWLLGNAWLNSKDHKTRWQERFKMVCTEVRRIAGITRWKALRSKGNQNALHTGKKHSKNLNCKKLHFLALLWEMQFSPYNETNIFEITPEYYFPRGGKISLCTKLAK